MTTCSCGLRGTCPIYWPNCPEQAAERDWEIPDDDEEEETDEAQ